MTDELAQAIMKISVRLLDDTHNPWLAADRNPPAALLTGTETARAMEGARCVRSARSVGGPAPGTASADLACWPGSGTR